VVLSIGIYPDHIRIEHSLQLWNLLRVRLGTNNHLTLPHFLKISYQLHRKWPYQLLDRNSFISFTYQDVIKIHNNDKLITFSLAHRRCLETIIILIFEILFDDDLHLLYYIDQITHIDSLLLIARVDRKRITASSKSCGCLLVDFFEWLQLM
jgi:hypothetical protein